MVVAAFREIPALLLLWVQSIIPLSLNVADAHCYT